MAEKVWLEKEDVKRLIFSCERPIDRAIIQLGAWVGLRSHEMAGHKVGKCSKCGNKFYYNYGLEKAECPKCEERGVGTLIDGEEKWEGLRVRDLQTKEIDGDQEYFLQVAGKQTAQEKGEGKKKHREAYIPQKVASDLNMVIRMNDLSDEDPLLPNRYGNFYTPKGIQKRVEKVANTAYEETGDEIFRKVSSHDLRRFFAHHHMVELGKNPRHIMAQGGWESFQAIKPYLSKPSRSNLAKSLKDVKRE